MLVALTSVADLECLYRIPDPNFPSRIPGQKDSESGFTSKNLSIFNPKTLFLSFRKNDLGCSSLIPNPDFFPIINRNSKLVTASPHTLWYPGTFLFDAGVQLSCEKKLGK
jgi:hypothetical protein